MELSIRAKFICYRFGITPIQLNLAFVLLLSAILPIVSAATSSNSSEAIVYVNEIPSDATRIVDVRPKNQCESATIQTALCFPVEQLFADNDRLANFSGLLWMLGTADLNGTEAVLLVGDKMSRKNAFAGLLYSAGQANVLVHTGNLSATQNTSKNEALVLSVGRSRSTTRTKVFTATPRTQTLMTMAELQNELSLQHAEPLIDTRTESEYWGRSIRAARGGHIPGAIWGPNVESALQLEARRVMVYGHNALDGLAQLAKWTAAGVQTRVYLAGWEEWAADTQNVVDAQSFRTVPLVSANSAQLNADKPPTQNKATSISLGFLNSKVPAWLLLLVLLVGVVIIGYQQRKPYR